MNYNNMPAAFKAKIGENQFNYIVGNCNRLKSKLFFLKIADLLFKKFKFSSETTIKILLAKDLSKWTIYTVSFASAFERTGSICYLRVDTLLKFANAALQYTADTYNPEDATRAYMLIRGKFFACHESGLCEDDTSVIEKRFRSFLSECDLIFDHFTKNDFSTKEIEAKATRQAYTSSWAVSSTR